MHDRLWDKQSNCGQNFYDVVINKDDLLAVEKDLDDCRFATHPAGLCDDPALMDINYKALSSRPTATIPDFRPMGKMPLFGLQYPVSTLR